MVNRMLLEGRPAGLTRDGFSSAEELTLVDPREFSSNADFPEIFTQQVRKLAGSGLNRARSVDVSLRRADPEKRKAIESNLIIYAVETWQIRTGEVACTCITDMISNTIRILQRIDFCRTLTLESVRVQASKLLILEYYAFLERFYVRQYATPLRDEMFARFGQLSNIWSTTKSLWNAIPAPMQGTGRYVNIEMRSVVRCRYSSADRSRSRSRSPRNP